MADDMDEFWVFGYGSLMWRPDFPYLEEHRATLYGLHRSLCVYSHVHRGTPERPGLVFGLDRGGACRGVVFRVADADRDNVLNYLRERELVTHVYRESWRRVRLRDGSRRCALTYVVDQSHKQYAGRLTSDKMLDIVRGARGKSGENIDYVLSTVEQLRDHRVRDGALDLLYNLLTQPT